MMLQITDNAATWMRAALSEEGEDRGRCFRIIVTGTGVQLMRGTERPDDVVAYAHEDKVILVLDAATAEFLKNHGVDYDTDTSELIVARAAGHRIPRRSDPRRTNCSDEMNESAATFPLGAER